MESPPSATPFSEKLLTPSSSSSPSSFAAHHVHRPAHSRASSLHTRRQLILTPRSSRWTTRLRPWIPILLYIMTSLVFVVAIGWYRDELFTYLDELSSWLRSDEYGHATLFFLIFITTIPPVPLYSTLIILAGYTYGPWTGAIISYFAALFGALFVFLLSRALLRETIERWLCSTRGLRRVVRAIEKRPKLLFLVRLAPYPYNVMNCLLAASPTLTLHTYTVCTALSLFKVIIHTSVGASIHSFKDYHHQSEEPQDSSSQSMNQIYTGAGIVLCILILIYLSYVANRAVDDELDDAPITANNPEETVSFLADTDLESACPRDRPMSELPTPRPSFSDHQWS